MPNHLNRRGGSVSEGNATLTSRVQTEDGNHAQTAGTRKRAARRQGFSSQIQGTNLLRVSTATKDRILCGTQAQFNAYKQAVQAQRGQLTGPVFEAELYGPHPIQVREFDGFGPLGE